MPEKFGSYRKNTYLCITKSSSRNLRHEIYVMSPDYFCDRTEETENIFSALQNGRNITLISPRKIGKTGLINHAFYRVREQESDIICSGELQRQIRRY